MHNTDKILGYLSSIIIIVSFVIFSFRGGLSALASLFADREYNYEFDKERLPICFAMLTCLAFFTFLLGAIISENLESAALFCFMNTVFAGMCLSASICYVPKDKTKKQ